MEFLFSEIKNFQILLTDSKCGLLMSQIRPTIGGPFRKVWEWLIKIASTEFLKAIIRAFYVGKRKTQKHMKGGFSHVV
jgi:hypothetical protein